MGEEPFKVGVKGKVARTLKRLPRDYGLGMLGWGFSMN